MYHLLSGRNQKMSDNREDDNSKDVVRDDSKSKYDKLLEQLQNPWDWAAAFIGGTVGSFITVILHGGDLGHSVPTGALAAVAARKSFALACSGPSYGERQKICAFC